MHLNLWSPSDPDEEEFHSRIVKASDEKLDVVTLYQAEGPRLRRFFRRRFARPEQVADMVQRLFTRLIGVSRGGRGAPDRPEAYLTTMAVNLVRDEARSVHRRNEANMVVLDEERVATVDPHHALEARDMLRRIDQAIVALPDRTREIFMAHRFGDLTYPQIAERLGISIKTVEVHISKALQILHRAAGFPE